MKIFAVALAVFFLSQGSQSYAATVAPHFSAPPELVVVVDTADQNTMRLTKPFSFTDRKGKLWLVPAGFETDGASIPRYLWIHVGPPFGDRYLRAAIVHDYYCVAHSETWENVHLMFYHALLACGVSDVLASTMYAAVYGYGPRWLTLSEKHFDGTEYLTVITQHAVTPDSDMRMIFKWIAKRKPSLAEIRRKLDLVVTVYRD